jgi:hypothetical protein
VARIQNVLSFSRLPLSEDREMLHQPDFRPLTFLELRNSGLHGPVRLSIKLSPAVEYSHLSH